MTTSITEKIVRYLSPSDAYFSNQNSWKHFVLAAQIMGATKAVSWRIELDAVQLRHSLLSVCIDADENGARYFRFLPDLRLQTIWGDASQGWEDAMETELSAPFPVKDLTQTV